MLKFTVYILFSQSINKFYIGYTNNIDRRIAEHNRKKGKYTDKGIPWIIVYSEEFQSKKEAQLREKQIKKMKSRNYILDLIQKQK